MRWLEIDCSWTFTTGQLAVAVGWAEKIDGVRLINLTQRDTSYPPIHMWLVSMSVQPIRYSQTYYTVFEICLGQELALEGDFVEEEEEGFDGEDEHLVLVLKTMERENHG